MNTQKRLLRIVTWNINGWRAAHRKGFAEWMTLESPDIVCLQETRLSNAQTRQYRPAVSGYNGFFTGGLRAGYSGTALLTKDMPISVGTSGIALLDVEGRTIVAHFDNFVVVNVYIPNGNRGPERLQFKHEFLTALRDYIVGLTRNGSNVLVCGDFNIAHTHLDYGGDASRASLRSGFLQSERNLIDALLNLGWSDTFRVLHPQDSTAFTWWAAHADAKIRNAGWRFDYVFISSNFAGTLRRAWMHSAVTISDHCPFAVEIETDVARHQPVSNCALHRDDVFQSDVSLPLLFSGREDG